MFRFAQHDRLLAFVRWLLEFGFESQKKELARNRFRASSEYLYPYVNLVAIIMMITVVAVIAVPAVPVIPIIAVVRIRSVIPVRVISISVVIAIPRITNPDSD